MPDLIFPSVGDHADVALDLAALDFQRGVYTVQPGDTLGKLAAVLYPGLTASDPRINTYGTAYVLDTLPAPGERIALPLYSTMFLRGAIARAEGRPLVKVPGVIAGHHGFPTATMLGAVGQVDRARVVQLVRAYVGYHQGEQQFEEVTQGRQTPGYSACGDLWNFVLERIGVRDPAVVNRNIPSAGIKWQDQKNLSTPYGGAVKNKAWTVYKPGLVPNVGDLVLIGTYPQQIQHALVHLGNEGNEWTSGDYGQVDIKTGLASSKFVVRTLADGKLGTRDLLGWIDLDKIPRQAEANYGLPGSTASTKQDSALWKFVTGVAIAVGFFIAW